MGNDTVVLYPPPFLGHIVSMVGLAKFIFRHHGHRFSSITVLLTNGFCDTPNTASYLDSIRKAHPFLTFHRFPSVPLDTTPGRSFGSVVFQFIRDNAPNARRALEEISETSNISAFIIDLFCSSALSVGKDLSIPTFYFYTSGAACLLAFLQFPKIVQGTSQSFRNLNGTLFNFHFLPPLKATHMPEPLLDRNETAFDEFVFYCSSLPLSDGIVCNTFEELEAGALRAISGEACLPGVSIPPIYCIGPLITPADENVGGECLSWLDKQPSESVVFLCFGSRGVFSAAQIKEIAHGLERSQQRFLWVVKPPKDESMKGTEYTGEFDLEAVLPNGFLERVKDRGMVVKSWVPQVAVLNHNSVGGFVTHCGWNSILEAVVAGVPMVAWPLYAEQHLNANFLVESLKLAIGLEHRESDEFVYGIELEKKVRELIETETGREIKERSRRMREEAIAAMKESGSSSKALADFVEEWKKSRQL